MKITGAVLILIACISAGLGYCKLRKMKISCLFELCRALSILKGELATSLLPLPRLFRSVSEKSKGDCAVFFSLLSSSLEEISEEDFNSLWEKTASSIFKALSEDELKAFSSLGCVLGKFQIDQQLSALENVIAVLQSSLSSEKSAFSAQQRLSLGLSAAGAMLILLVLM